MTTGRINQVTVLGGILRFHQQLDFFKFDCRKLQQLIHPYELFNLRCDLNTKRSCVVIVCNLTLENIKSHNQHLWLPLKKFFL
jgi:hypothetical protein